MSLYPFFQIFLDLLTFTHFCQAVREATSIPLESMAEPHAVHLAREYLSKRGGEKLSEDKLQELVRACDLVPLAIRLSIDGYIAGQSIDKAQANAKGKILEFSYNNLIEVLSDASKALLECLFVTTPEPISRPSASLLLQRSDDEIAEAFSQLRGTSLVTKFSDQVEESYTLSSSVRELLRLSPIDSNIRQAVQKQHSRIKAQIKNARQQGLNPLSKTYISDNAPDHVKIQAAEAFKTIKHRNPSSERLNTALKSIEQAIEAYREQPVLYRAKGMLLIKMMDRPDGIRTLKQAWAIEPRDAASGLQLSYELREDRDYAEAKDVAEKLIDLGYDDPKQSDAYHASLVLKNYWLPLIWLGETDQVLEETIDWKKIDKSLRPTYALMRVQAFRESSRAVQVVRASSTALRNAVEILDNLFKSEEGYAGIYVDEGIKLLRSLADVVMRTSEFKGKKGKNNLSEETKRRFVSFAHEHTKQMCEIHSRYKLDHPDIRKTLGILSSITLKEGLNPLKAEPWKDIINFEELDSEDSLETDEDWIRVKVINTPPGKTYLFARNDADKLHYIIHKSKLSSPARYWSNLKRGDYLYVKPAAPEIDQSAIKVVRARVRQSPAKSS